MKKEIKKTITLEAPKEKVWAILTEDQYNRKWYEAFSEGTIAETDWQEGSRAVFKDHKGMGLVGVIETSQPGKHLAIRYLGEMIDGKDDFESENSLGMKDLRETYTITETGGMSRLDVTVDIPETYFQMMDEAWDAAMKIIKNLAETV